MTLPTSINDQLARLAAFDPSPYPVISLYLNTQPNERGRDNFQAFVRKELKARAQTYPARSSEREMLERDAERIASYLQNDMRPSANGVAIFACDAAGFFEAVQLDAPVDDHWLYVGDRPHLYPLARLASQFPRYAVVLADTNRTRILVVAHGGVAHETPVQGVKTRRATQGGWAQARYQRHVENYHLHHIKDVVERLEKIVMREGIQQIVIAGDPVVIPLLREQLPKPLAEKIVDEISLDSSAAQGDVLKATLESLKEADAKTNREKVDAAAGAFRAGGLGVVGPDATLLALTNGQVDELLIAASLADIEGLRGTRAGQMAMANDTAIAEPAVEPGMAGEPSGADIGTVRLADELVTKAQQTSARICFVEDASLLAPYGGVAATLRYRI
ncbi:MAG TPA: Vms1/Ankzf1 family peptidyl-tRNA hydrolase [Vicinamibacterales bacterium]|nr:Vms1/Ankzf1 family peptidyl-tRNA hydrolase [Vicinamibacterales bacterium]